MVREGFIGRCALTATTLLARDGEAVVGYYSLAVGVWDDAGQKGLARHPIPVMVLARLAVDRRHQGREIGQGLLKDALPVPVAEQAGIRAILGHAKDAQTRSPYQRFVSSPRPSTASDTIADQGRAERTLPKPITPNPRATGIRLRSL